MIKITFHLDGTGICYDPNEPIHLDALLSWALTPMQDHGQCLDKQDVPKFIRLPLKLSRVNGSLVWHASALFPEGCNAETLRFWRKKFRQDRMEITNGSPNLQCSVYREYNMPVPLLLVRNMVAYCVPSTTPSRVISVLRKHVKFLGRKRSYGYGKIEDIVYKEVGDDCSLTSNGVAMRYLPHPNGTRLVRSLPPYWNSMERVKCISPGELVENLVLN